MISITIFINAQPVMARSAINKGDDSNGVDSKGRTKYLCDDGSIIWHKRENGAVALAKLLLNTIKEPR